jgi:molybdopterin synthase sulfur carrier subunit
MITLVFFASVREQLGIDRLDVEICSEQSVDEMLRALILEKGALWGDVLGQKHILVAVNHEMTAKDTIIKDGDEIAFFPPVTGG